jgi:hypothetical protein
MAETERQKVSVTKQTALNENLIPDVEYHISLPEYKQPVRVKEAYVKDLLKQLEKLSIL